MKKCISCMVMIWVIILQVFAVSVNAEEEKLLISMEKINLYIKQSYQLTVTGTSAEIIFHSEDTKVADVSGDGTVTAISLGSTKIVAETVSGLKAECVVNVLNGVSPKDIVISSQDITLTEGQSYTLQASVKPEEADQTLKFTTSDNAVARVDNNGYIKALKAGVAVITVTSTSDAVSRKCIVKVNADVQQQGTEISVKGALYSISGEKKNNMTVELRNSSGFKRTQTDENGNFSITGVKQGDYALLVYRTEKDMTPTAKAQISAGAYNLNISCIMNGNDIVVLYQNNTAITSDIKELVLGANSVSLEIGENYDMSFYARPSKAVLPAVMGESDDETIATVDADGRITAVAEGTAVITYLTLDGTLSKSCTVTVSDSVGNKNSWLIITVETALVLIGLAIFTVRYIKFMKKKEREEFGFDKEDV